MDVGAFFRRQDAEEPEFWGPLPPLSGLDFESLVKYVQSAERYCQEHKRGVYAFLDWAIHVIATSMSMDCASRIFLPKTETTSFDLDDLFPFSAVSPTGRTSISLGNAFVIAPLWSNSESCYALDAIRGEGFDEELSDEAITGCYIEELNMAFIRSGAHLAYFGHFLGQGQVMLDTYSIADLRLFIRTDGRDWLLSGEEEDEEEAVPVREPRMAALYQLALWRFTRPK